MEIKDDGWLAEIMGRPVFRLEGVGPEPDTAPLRAHLERFTHSASNAGTPAAGGGGAFYYAKVDTRDIEAVRRLGAVGFYTADVNVGLRLDRPPATPRSAEGVSISTLRAGDEEALLAIAETTYELSRFHLDPQVPRPIADRIKRQWAANYVRGSRGDRLFVAYADGAPVGFLAALRSAHGAVIDLVGVAQAARGRGAGGALVSAFVEHYREAGVAELTVGTQVANIPSLRMYERLGFSFEKSQYVLHLHLPEGPAPAADRS